jgi:cytochrome bd-type quinol oxidase subunit 2
MIQRIQSLWLLLAAVAAGLMYKLPIYSGVLNTGAPKALLVGQSYLLFIVTAILVVFPLITIFLFKNRSKQKQLIWVTLLLNAVFIGLVWMQVDEFVTANAFTSSVYKIGAGLPIVSIILLLLAWTGIRKDEKLIKSADRLR